MFSFIPCSARDAVFLEDRLDSPTFCRAELLSSWSFFPQILSLSAPATIAADLAAEEDNTAVPRYPKYYPARVRGTRQLLSGCSQLPRVPSAGVPPAHLVLQLRSNRVCSVMKTRNCLFAFFHTTNHPLLAPTLSCEAAPALS